MNIKNKSKRLAYLLRHDRKYQFDANGWREVSDLTEKHGFTFEDLCVIVDTNNKQRFEFSEDMQYIRARQGHSIHVDIELEECVPPPINWRMPTFDELSDLMFECKWEWIDNNDCVGYRVIGPNGNSIFLPAAGCYENSSKNYRFDIGGYYWSSSELFWHELTGTFLLEFNEEYVDGDNTYRRHCGYSIRPVTDK